MSKVSAEPADTSAMSPISTAFPLFSLPNAQDSGLATLASAAHRLNLDAQQIANPADQDPTTPLLASNQALLLGQAGAEVIRTSDQMMGTLLDIFA